MLILSDECRPELKWTHFSRAEIKDIQHPTVYWNEIRLLADTNDYSYIQEKNNSWKIKYIVTYCALFYLQKLNILKKISKHHQKGCFSWKFSNKSTKWAQEVNQEELHDLFEFAAPLQPQGQRKLPANSRWFVLLAGRKRNVYIREVKTFIPDYSHKVAFHATAGPFHQ